MKLPYFIFIGLILTIFCSESSDAQNREVMTDIPVFSKAITSYDFSNDFSFDWSKIKPATGTDYKVRGSGIDLEATHFIMHNFGIGAGINTDRSKQILENVEILTSSTLGSVHALYGRDVGGINLYGKAKVLAGVSKYNYNAGTYNDENKYNEFGVNFEIGSPILIKKQSGLYFTPVIGYNYMVSKEDEYKDIISGFYLGSNMMVNLPCSEYADDCDEIMGYSEGRYSPGVNVLNGSFNLSTNAGNIKSSYDGSNGEGDTYPKESYSGIFLNSKFHRYVLENLAVGGGLRLDGSVNKIKEEDEKYNDFSWMVMPGIMANLPLEGHLNNAYGFLDVGIGQSKSKSTYNESTTETTYSNTMLGLGVGYNLFITDGIAVVPNIGYSWRNQKNTENEDITKRNRFETELFLRYSF